MAEFLIYNKDHWMDSLTQGQIRGYTKNNPNFMDKYNARYQRGDIVEVREDGFYTNTLKGDLTQASTGAFRYVSIPGLEADKAYMEPVMGGDTIAKRRRYSIQDGNTKTVHSVTNIADITLTDKSI